MSKSELTPVNRIVSRREFFGIVGRSGTAALLATVGIDLIAAAQQRQPQAGLEPHAIYDPSLQNTTQTELAEALGPKIGEAVPVPESYPAIKVRALTQGIEIDGDNVPKFSEGRWFHPVYDPTHAGQDDNYEGIGPHYPVAVNNLGRNPLRLTSDGTTGRLTVSAKEGGRVQFSVMQLDAFQDDGAWSDGVQNPDWEMQYAFNGLRPNQRIIPINTDTGRRLVWNDGTLVEYRADNLGTSAFRIPETHGRDVRIGFIFNISAQIPGQAPQRITIERSPIVNPELGGVNSLPGKGIIKRMLLGQPN